MCWIVGLCRVCGASVNRASFLRPIVRPASGETINATSHESREKHRGTKQTDLRELVGGHGPEVREHLARKRLVDLSYGSREGKIGRVSGFGMPPIVGFFDFDAEETTRAR